MDLLDQTMTWAVSMSLSWFHFWRLAVQCRSWGPVRKSQVFCDALGPRMFECNSMMHSAQSLMWHDGAWFRCNYCGVVPVGHAQFHLMRRLLKQAERKILRQFNSRSNKIGILFQDNTLSTTENPFNPYKDLQCVSSLQRAKETMEKLEITLSENSPCSFCKCMLPVFVQREVTVWCRLRVLCQNIPTIAPGMGFDGYSACT